MWRNIDEVQTSNICVVKRIYTGAPSDTTSSGFRRHRVLFLRRHLIPDQSQILFHPPVVRILLVRLREPLIGERHIAGNAVAGCIHGSEQSQRPGIESLGGRHQVVSRASAILWRVVAIKVVFAFSHQCILFLRIFGRGGGSPRGCRGWGDRFGWRCFCGLICRGNGRGRGITLWLELGRFVRVILSGSVTRGWLRLRGGTGSGVGGG